MVRLSYCSLNLAESEVSAPIRLIQPSANRLSSGTFFYRLVVFSVSSATMFIIFNIRRSIVS
jgi:hypothetical protein